MWRRTCTSLGEYDFTWKFLVGAKDGEEFATINHLPILLLQRQAFITQAFLHGGGAAGSCGWSPWAGFALRDFQAEAVVDAIAPLLILCTFRNSLKIQVKVQFRNQFWNPKRALSTRLLGGSHMGNKMASDPKNGW